MPWWAILLIILFIIFFIWSFISNKRDTYERKHLVRAQVNYKISEKNTFEENKENFKKLLNEFISSKSWTMLKDTKYERNLENCSGIYAIFVKSEEIHETIPIYVGQAKDIFKRWKQHQNQIEKVIKENINIRTYKKIVHFLNIYNLKIQDLNFIVLEKCSVEYLNEKEKYYINIFNSHLYGFNQTNGNY